MIQCQRKGQQALRHGRMARKEGEVRLVRLEVADKACHLRESVGAVSGGEDGGERLGCVEALRVLHG